MPLDVSPVERRAGRVIAQLNRQRDHGTDHHVVASVIIPRCGAGAKLMDGATAPSFSISCRAAAYSIVSGPALSTTCRHDRQVRDDAA